jgi:hypothetical protein
MAATVLFRNIYASRSGKRKMFLVAVFSKKTHNTQEMGRRHRRMGCGVHFEFHETVSLSAETLHALSIDAR